MEEPYEEPYHERQRLLLCGVHAVNNILGGNEYSKADFDAIADELAAQPDVAGVSGGWFNPHRSKLRLGDFDENVLAVALQRHDLSCVPSLGSSNATGLIQAVGSAAAAASSSSPSSSSSSSTVTVDFTSDPPAIWWIPYSDSPDSGISVPVEWVMPCPPCSPTAGLDEEEEEEEEKEKGQKNKKKGQPLLVPFEVETCNGALRSEVKLANGSSFKNPLDIWSPSGFIVNVQKVHMLGLFKTRHWFAVKAVKGCESNVTGKRGMDSGGGGGGSSGERHRCEFFNFDSNLQSPERFDCDLGVLEFLMSFPDLRIVRKAL